MTARHEANLVRIGVGIEIANDNGGETVSNPGANHFGRQCRDLVLANVAVVQAPIQVRAPEIEDSHRRFDPHPQGYARLSVTPIGKLQRITAEDRPTARHRVPERSVAVSPEVAGPFEVAVVDRPFAEDLGELVEPIAHQRLLEADEIRIEPLDPLGDPRAPLRPRPGVVPQVQGEDGNRQAILRGRATSADAKSGRFFPREQDPNGLAWRKFGTGRSTMTAKRFQQALDAIDRANAADPHRIDHGGASRPKELVHGELVSRWIERLAPRAGEALQLAGRAHHLERWAIPRASHPDGRDGYLAWRRALQDHHVARARGIHANCTMRVLDNPR